MRRTKQPEVDLEGIVPPPRGADESALEFLGSRQRSTPLEAPTVREKLIALRRDVEAQDRAQIASWYNDGEVLNTVYMRHGDAVLSASSFRALLREWWPLNLASAYERMRVAKYATRAQAEKYRLTRCRLACRLAEKLKCASLAALEELDLQLPAEEGGGTVRLAQADAEQLAAALRLLKAPKLEDAEKSRGEELVDVRAWVKAQCEDDEEIAALVPTTFLRDGEVTVRVSAVGARQAKAAARFYERLARRR